MLRSLQYIDQHISADLSFWYACSGLEVSLSSILENVVVGSFTSHEIAFDYDLVYNATLGITAALSIIEERMTESIADKFLQCERNPSNLKRLLEDSDETKIITVYSLPLDTIDSRVGRF